MNDIQLRKHILDELAFEPSVNAARIGVGAQDGVVTLSGHVGTFAEKRAAEAAASRVRGVRAIVENLTVVPSDSQHTSDEEIARRVLDALEWSAHIPKGEVQVKVEAGRVTLSGDVDSYFRRRAAEDAVIPLAGVTALTNLINMRPDASAKDVESRVGTVLRRNRRLSGGDVHARVFGGMVTLMGSVDCLQAKQLAERAAWGVGGVQWVNNELTVDPKLAETAAAT